ncbi:MFS transporter [Flavobacterium piscis]|uniref:MFS transporter n=1 Tax=Flavobacterium piscis TaxID=1114874 RepID=A0ABX2XDL6_9FLAO|nr:MFS transporter [Flavobacterium piscis]OCB69966.1 MFS transporter [Flavobacterium piscis]OXE99224.1 MFS transporter [Flavobacterium piscis]
MQKEHTIFKLLPILLGFFIMGFCDLVGISVTYAQSQFNWSETQAGFLPSMVFLWFFILSIPAAIAMDKYGRKNLVSVGLLITLIATVIPVVSFNETSCYITFILLGIGNTILQVSLNPLLTNIVNGKQLTSFITGGQFIKAISSFAGPLLVGYFSLKYGSWEKSFYIYTLITSISLVWLFFTKIEEVSFEKKTASFSKTIGLLKDNNILLSFLGILCIVGLDVGMNTVTPKLLIERAGLAKEAATYGSSWYFAARTIGTVFGVLLLSKFSEKSFFKINMIVVLLALTGLIFVQNQSLILLLVCIIAFGSSSIFAVIYTLAIKSQPSLTNEISGLMVTGVAGGAIIPPLMGFATDYIGTQQGAVGIIILCAVYLVYCSFRLNNSIIEAK